MNKALKDRIDAIRQDPSAVHYVKTEIGILPCDWEVAKLSDIAEKVTQTARTDFYETVSISAGIGFVNQTKKFGKELSGKQYEKYNVIHKGDFSYNKGNSNKYPQGCIYRLKDRETAAVPNVFESFRIRSECADFYDHLFVSGFLNQQLSKKINHGVRDDGLLNLTEKDFYSCLLPVPPLAEQKKISEILDHCDKLIKRCEAKVDEYKSLKKTCLSKMFPQNSSNVPELRFPGFTGAWEQRRFSELTEIRSASRVHKEEWQTSGVPFYRSSDVMSALNGTDNEKAYISEELYEKLSSVSGKLEKGDVLITGGGSVGKPYIVPNNDPLYTKDADLLWIKNNKELDAYFIYTFFFSHSFMDYIRSVSHVGTIAHYTITQLGETPITLPSISEQQRIGLFFQNLDRLITLHQREVEEYTRFKKAMTQLLLTGIVRVHI